MPAQEPRTVGRAPLGLELLSTALPTAFPPAPHALDEDGRNLVQTSVRVVDPDRGDARLAGVLGRAGELDPEEPCDRLLAEAGLDDSDDNAFLALRPCGGPA